MGGDKMKNIESIKLSEFYSMFPWPDDPESPSGQEYFAKTLRFMERLVEHPWIKELLEKKRVRILEVCCGIGFGGIALSKLLSARNIDVEILLTDLREDALAKAEYFGKKSGIGKIKTMVIDAREIYKIEDSFDIVLLYGLSTPHFNPWELVKIISSVSFVLNEKGIFVLDESDRRYSVFLNRGYKWVLAEGDNEKFTVSFHTGYDLKKGTFKRVHINPFGNSIKPVTMETFMWGLAEVGALMWIFFQDVDMVQLEGTRHFIVGYIPRKQIKPDEFKKPALFREK
jgi:SAM-dependent methyltransferase